MNAPAVLVTRPSDSNQELASALLVHGFKPVLLPCLSIVPIPLDAQSKEMVLELDRYRFVVAISVNAAQHAIAWFEDFWPQWPLAQYWIGIGEKTRAYLESKDVPILTMQWGSTSETLMQSLNNIQWHDHRVLMIRGEGGREWLGEHLTELGAKVDYLACYRRAMPEGLCGAVHEFGVEPALDIITVSSGETLRNLTKACSPFKKWFSIPVVVPSERVADMANEWGWQDIIIAQSAYDEAMVAAVIDAFQA